VQLRFEDGVLKTAFLAAVAATVAILAWLGLVRRPAAGIGGSGGHLLLMAWAPC